MSYSHDDAVAARHIAEALRGAGLEVWFDENELRGGDSWDAKIKTQIRDCALFLPVISLNTQRRREGYFRLEWHLAEERSRLIARGTPFLVPVAIDDVAERAALVPEVFLSVQWTRLLGGEAGAAFGERVNHLLRNDAAPVVAGVADPGPASTRPATVAVSSRRVPAAAWIACAAVATMLVAGFIVLRPSPNAGAGTRPPTSEKPVATATALPTPAGPRLGPKSIAVLPFDNLSEDKDANAFFADGMHEDLITNLLLIRELRCVPRTTAMSFRGTKKTLSEIADELGVAYVLTGTVRRADKHIRLTGTLINPRTDEPLWSKPYDKEITDAGVIFAIQSELAQSIAGELKAVLSPQEKKLVERRPTESTAAYDLFLKARQLRNANLSEKTVREAEALLQAAVTLDQKFAIAWSELSYAHGYLYIFNHDNSAARADKAKAAIEMALQLAPDEPEVILNHGYYFYFCLNDYRRAEALFAEGSRRQPNSPMPHHARGAILRRQGRIKESMEEFRAAAMLDPGNFDTAVQITLVEAASRRWPQAKAAQEHERELRPPSDRVRKRALARLDFWATGSALEFENNLAAMTDVADGDAFKRRLRLDLALIRGDLEAILLLAPKFDPGAHVHESLLQVTALLALGKVTEARAQLASGLPAIRRRIDLEPRNARVWSTLGLVEALLGNREAAVRAARRAVELSPESVDAWKGPEFGADLAFVYAWTGDKDRALKEYARLLGLPSFGGLTSISGTNAYLTVHAMRHHPFFFPLQGDPRFEALLADPKNNAPLF